MSDPLIFVKGSMNILITFSPALMSAGSQDMAGRRLWSQCSAMWKQIKQMSQIWVPLPSRNEGSMQCFSSSLISIRRSLRAEVSTSNPGLHSGRPSGAFLHPARVGWKPGASLVGIKAEGHQRCCRLLLWNWLLGCLFIIPCYRTLALTNKWRANGSPDGASFGQQPFLVTLRWQLHRYRSLSKQPQWPSFLPFLRDRFSSLSSLFCLC